MTTNFAGAVLLTAERAAVAAPATKKTLRKSDHGFRHEMRNGQKWFFCACSFQEGFAPSGTNSAEKLKAARQNHQSHLANS